MAISNLESFLSDPKNRSSLGAQGAHGGYGSYLTPDARKRLLNESPTASYYADAMIRTHSGFGSMQGFDRQKYDQQSRSRYIDEYNRNKENAIYGELNRSVEYSNLADSVSQGLATSGEISLYEKIRSLMRLWKNGQPLKDDEMTLLRKYLGVSHDMGGGQTTYTY